MKKEDILQKARKEGNGEYEERIQGRIMTRSALAENPGQPGGGPVLSGWIFGLYGAVFDGAVRRRTMKAELVLKNRLKETRTAAGLSQAQLAAMVGVSRNTISSIETGQFNPTAKLALILCIALDKKFEELFYFDD